MLFVVFLGAVYFFIYIPNNERRLQAQRFRTLQNINKNIQEKIRNSEALMNNLLKNKIDTGYIDYLSEQSKENFTLIKPLSNGTSPTKLKSITDSGYTINSDNDNRYLNLRLYKLAIKTSNSKTDTITYEMAMKFTFEQFFKGLLPKYVFDEYVVFNNGLPVFETSHFSVDLKDTVFGKNKLVNAPVIDYTISGIDYKLFLQQVSFIAGNDWTVVGLLSNERYQQEKNQLPSSIILLLVTIVLAIIISFPWIKLYQMGNKDRLTLWDGIGSIAVSMLLMSILFFSFFKYNHPLRTNDYRDSKPVLAEAITTALKNEIDTIYNKLYFIDSNVAAGKIAFEDRIRDSKVFKGSPSPDSLRWVKTLQDTNIRQVFWLDVNGNEVRNWTSEKKIAPKGNFSERAYFKNISNQKDYRTSTGGRYYLDQVISWTSGNFTSVLAIPSTVKIGSISVAAMSFTMKSLDKPVLPAGYQFAIIDKSGKVLYHSDVSHNLNEELVTEFSEKKKLISTLAAKTEDIFQTSYFAKDFNVLVKPIERLPYFIVVFSDLSYDATREMAIYSFTFSMMLLLFGFFIVQLLIVFLVSSKRSFFKKQTYDTSWIGPKTNYHHQYNLTIFLNVFVIFIALVFFPHSSFLAYIFILLFSVTGISLFLNCVFAKVYKANKPDNYRFKISTCWWLLALLLVIDLTALKILDTSSSKLLLAYEAIIILAGIYFYQNGANILNTLRRFTSKHILRQWTYKRSFAFMALARLIITSGIPIAFFYISAYNYEQNISIRYRQLQYANELLNKLDTASLSKVDSNTSFAKGYYADGMWVKKISIVTPGPKLSDSEENNVTSKILDLFRINFTDLSVKEDRFSAAHASDSSFGYNPLLKDACKRDSATKTYLKLHNGKYLAIESAGLNYKLPSVFSSSWFNGLLFWGLLLTALGIFYFIVYNIISKLFCLNLPNLTLCAGLDAKIILDEKINNLLFVIGLPGSGKLKMITEEIKNGGIKHKDETLLSYFENHPVLSNVFVADLINIPDLGDEKSRNEVWQDYAKKIFTERNRLIIINHFEYNIQCAITNRIKLNFIEQLMLENKCKIIILSTIHPVAFLDSVSEPSKTTGTPVRVQDMERWHVLLGHYRIVVFPLRHKHLPANMDYAYKSLYKETEHTHFLNDMRDCVLKEAKELSEKNMVVRQDEWIFKMQVSSHYFYMYIWQSLTKEEKFLLYDLAEDNLVNGYDDYNLNMLMAKGAIIRNNGTLMLFNRGFRNFILAAIGNTEAMKIKNRIKDNGNWSRLRLPLMIVAAAILTFLLASQKEAYTELMTYIAALGAGIPALLKLFSLFNKPEAKE